MRADPRRRRPTTARRLFLALMLPDAGGRGRPGIKEVSKKEIGRAAINFLAVIIKASVCLSNY